MNYDLETIRSQFPALALTDKGQPRVYLDNPAGTQVPVQVIQRMSDYLIHCNANQGGTFKTSIESDLILEEAHQAMADLLNAGSSSEIIFGANIGTTLTGWLVATLGFKLDLGEAVLPFVFIGAVLHLTGRPKLIAAGQALTGFGLLFIGIDFLKDGMAAFEGTVTPANFPPDTIVGRLKLVAIGLVITLVTQSSSADFGETKNC